MLGLDENIASNWDLYLITIITILLGMIIYSRRPPQADQIPNSNQQQQQQQPQQQEGSENNSGESNSQQQSTSSQQINNDNDVQ
jgi:hypothetical protein